MDSDMDSGKFEKIRSGFAFGLDLENLKIKIQIVIRVSL